MSLPALTWRTHYALALLTLVYLVQYVDRQIMAVLIEPIKHEFGASDTVMGLVSGFAFAIFYASVGVPLARLADRMARTRLLAACCATWSLFTVFCGAAASLPQLLAARVGVASGEAGCTPLAISLISDLYPRERRSFAMAVYGLGPIFGTVGGLSLGGWIAHAYGWRAAFTTMGLPGLVLALLVWVMREPARGAWERAVGLAAGPPTSSEQLPALSAAWQLLRRRAVLLLLLGASGAGFVGYGFGAWNFSFLVRTHGLTLAQAGAIAGLISGFGALIGTPVSGALCDRLARRDPAWQMRLPALGLAASLFGGLAYTLWPVGTVLQLGSTPIPTAILPSVIFGFFAPWWIAPSYAGIANLTAPGERTLASSLLVLSIVLFGGGAGPLFTGALSDALAARYGPEALRYALAITVLTTALPVAAFLAAARPYRAATTAPAAAPAGA